MTVVPVSSGNTARHHLLLQDFKPDVIAATPSFALHLAETLAEQGGKPRDLGLRVSIFGAEPWTDGIGSRSSGRSASSAFDIYGLSEIIGPASPVSARRATGVHRRRSLPAGDHRSGLRDRAAAGRKELVFTTVTKRAMPLVRYRTGTSRL